MALTLTVQQKSGLFKQRPDLAALRKQLGGVVHIGGLSPYLNYTEQPAAPAEGHEADYMLYGANAPLGRGFYLFILKGFSTIHLTSPLPTTTHDLEDMFTVAGLLAGMLGEKELEADNGHTVAVARLPQLYGETVKSNAEALRSYAASQPGFAVSGVRYPLHLPLPLCQRLASVPAEAAEKFFSAYLAEKQLQDFYYLKPRFFTDEATGEPYGSYILTAEVGSVIPKVPFVPYGPSPFGGRAIKNWQLTLADGNIGMLGTLPYTRFLELLTPGETSEFDERHLLLRGLRTGRLREILLEAGN